VRAGRAVDLDFSGVTVLASPFFNAAIGQLLRDLSSDQLNRLLKGANLTPVGANVMRQVIAGAKGYYAEPDYRRKEGLNKILTDDIDFCTVPGITVFTPNNTAISNAKDQGKLHRR